MNAPIHIVCGPTAGGKSAYALDLAQKMDGVIINCDSMQIYNGLALLAAQPSATDKQKIPHKLYGALHPDEVCSAWKWCTMASAAIEETFAENKTPIIVGGTGLYITALTQGLSPIPVVPDAIRKAANKKQKELGNPAFYEELKKRDPETAAIYHPNHTARLVRAWEILEATGKSFLSWQKEPRIPPPPHWRFEFHKIIPEREELIRRCDMRFLQMIEQGVLKEVSNFIEDMGRGYIAPSAPLTKALGFKPLKRHLEGEIKLEEAILLAQNETRRYAKRQTTWFRNQL